MVLSQGARVPCCGARAPMFQVNGCRSCCNSRRSAMAARWRCALADRRCAPAWRCRPAATSGLRGLGAVNVIFMAMTPGLDNKTARVAVRAGPGWANASGGSGSTSRGARRGCCVRDTCKNLHRRRGRTVAERRAARRHHRQWRPGAVRRGRVGHGQGRWLGKGWIGGVAAALGFAEACAHDKQIFILRKTADAGQSVAFHTLI